MISTLRMLVQSVATARTESGDAVRRVEEVEVAVAGQKVKVAVDIAQVKDRLSRLEEVQHGLICANTSS